MIMERLNIRPASDWEHQWRKALYVDQKDKPSKREVDMKLGARMRRMGISKPQMMIWYIIAQGRPYLEDLISKSEKEVEVELWRVYWRMNGEFGVHQPVR